MPHYIITDELRELAKVAIDSIKSTSTTKVISVDDGSPLDTSFLEDHSDHTIHLKKNSGFGKACNAGFRYVLSKDDASFIGCANNDIEVYQGWVDALIEPYGKWPDVGITGLVASKDKAIAEASRGRKITQGGLLNDHMQSGGLWLMSRMSFDAVYDKKLNTLFDERFAIGGEEDVDLFLRVREAGYGMVMSDKSCFWHKEGATRWNEEIAGFKERNKKIEDNNYDKFAEKWGYDIRQRGLRFTEEVLED